MPHTGYLGSNWDFGPMKFVGLFIPVSFVFVLISGCIWAVWKTNRSKQGK